MDKLVAVLISTLLEKDKSRPLSAVLLGVLVYWIITSGVGTLGVFGVKELESQAKNAKGELNRCDERVIALQAEIKQVRAELKAAEAALDKAEDELEDSEDEVADLKHQIQLLNLYLVVSRSNHKDEPMNVEDLIRYSEQEAEGTRGTTPKM